MQRGLKSVGLALAAAMMLAGSAMAQRGGGGFGFGGRGGGGINMLRSPEVQAELKLTDDQKTKVMALAEQRRGQGRGGGGNLRDLSPEERQKMLAERRAEEDKQLAAILNTDQMKRYGQLRLQQQGMTALAEKPVADQLSLTADQRTKIGGIIEAQRAEMRSAFQGGGGGGDREAMREKMLAMQKQTDAKIAALLTDTQKAKWQELVGAPFNFGGPGRQVL
jgi:Spy/CpxP family protein refolding chaperone